MGTPFCIKLEKAYSRPEPRSDQINGRPGKAILGDQSDQIISYMDSDLYKAAEIGQIEPFIKDQKTNLTLLVTPTKNTILHIHLSSDDSSKLASTSFVERVLDLSPSLLLQVNGEEETPLHLAARFGHSHIVQVLIERARCQFDDEEGGEGATREMLMMVNNSKDTALHEAVRNNHLHVVKELVRDFPNVLYYPNDNGETPLYIAAVRGYPCMVDEILETCKLVMFGGGPHGRTALHAAVMRHDYDFEKPITDKKSFMKEAEKNRWKWIDKSNSIRYRLSNTSSMIDKMLEKRKCLIIETDEFGWNPLHYAVYFNPYETTSTVSILLNYDKSIAYKGEASKNMIALHLAACLGYVQIMNEIISKCPDCCELVDNRGWNFVHYAVASKSDETLRFCLDNPSFANLVNMKDVLGNTPMHLLAASRPELPSILHNRTWVDLDALNKQKLRCMDISRNVFPKAKEQILEMMEDLGFGPRGKVVVNRKGSWERKDAIERFEKAKESHLVVSGLIATVTFAAAFTLPGGTDQGTASLNLSTAFQAFVITDSVAMVFSTSAVFIHFLTAAIGLNATSKWLFEAEIWFTITAMGAMVIAFVTGIYSVLIPSSGIAKAVCVIGSTFFLFLFYTFGRRCIFRYLEQHPRKVNVKAKRNQARGSFLSDQ